MNGKISIEIPEPILLDGMAQAQLSSGTSCTHMAECRIKLAKMIYSSSISLNERGAKLRHYNHAPGPRFRHTMIALGTHLMIFGGLDSQSENDYIGSHGREENQTECAWVLDTAQDLDWEPI